MGPKLSPGLRARLRADGLDLDKPLLPAYPAGRVAVWIDWALPEAYPGLAKPEAARALGRWSVEKYGETLIGKALVQMLKLIGLRRLLERMTRAMRTGGNYLETRCTVNSPTDVELWINDVNGLPTYFQGVLEGAASICGAKATVTVTATDGTQCILRCVWS